MEEKIERKLKRRKRNQDDSDDGGEAELDAEEHEEKGESLARSKSRLPTAPTQRSKLSEESKADVLAKDTPRRSKLTSFDVLKDSLRQETETLLKNKEKLKLRNKKRKKNAPSQQSESTAMSFAVNTAAVTMSITDAIMPVPATRTVIPREDEHTATPDKSAFILKVRFTSESNLRSLPPQVVGSYRFFVSCSREHCVVNSCALRSLHGIDLFVCVRNANQGAVRETNAQLTSTRSDGHMGGDGTNPKRKRTKTRSRQKNIRKDNRPAHLKPNYRPAPSTATQPTVMSTAASEKKSERSSNRPGASAFVADAMKNSAFREHVLVGHQAKRTPKDTHSMAGRARAHQNRSPVVAEAGPATAPAQQHPLGREEKRVTVTTSNVSTSTTSNVKSRSHSHHKSLSPLAKSDTRMGKVKSETCV